VCVLIPSGSPFTSLHSLSPDSASLSLPEISRKKQKTSFSRSAARDPAAYARTSSWLVNQNTQLTGTLARGPAQHHHESSCSATIETPAQKVPPRGLAPPPLDH
jgi:hypothetical protein